MVYRCNIKTPLGNMVAIASDEALTNLDFADAIEFETANGILEQVKLELDEYFLKKRKTFTVPLKPHGTSFEQEVWLTLLKIPYAKAISYKDEALMMGREKGFRAVANANGKNPISIIIPCHRVISSSGKLGGYSGGLEKKEFLLKLESIEYKL
ncbi:MAG: methylated-DNA--[protein]-cysteine S-methyltransferase [Sulfurimonas sp.]